MKNKLKASKEQKTEMLEISKKQRNLEDLQATLMKNMTRLDELAYRIENTKNKKLKEKLEKNFDKRLNFIISLQQGNYSIETH